MMKKGIKGTLFVLLSFLLLAGCNDKDEKSKVPETEIPVKVAKVTFGTLTDDNALTGTISAENEVAVLPKAVGEITAIYVKKGDKVKKGDVIAQLDDTTERNMVEQQQKSLEQAQANLQSAQNGRERAENSYMQAQASLKSAQASLQQAIDNIQNLDYQVQNARNAYQQAKKNLERMKSLYYSRKISLQEYENAQSAEKSAKIALEQAELSKRTSETEGIKMQEAAVEQAQANVNMAQTAIKDADVAVQQAQIQVEQAQLALDSAMEQLNNKVIRAPINGEVTEINGKVGELASNANPFAKIVSKDLMKLTVKITSNQLSSFHEGDELDVKVAGLAGTYKGTVTYVSSVGSGFGLFTVDLEIENKDQQIRPGMIASVIVKEIKQADSLIVPVEAVIQKEGKTVVFVVSNGKAEEREVEILKYGTDLVAVVGKLEENEKVVISGQNLLDDGNKVRIVEEE
ncbi:efflux RND transporter periplasmic adaptor subunit [Ureibacillus sp. FSL K6-8385]|mgnify:CR=1 FL=1|uniref:Efflux RND transporter periplasmic adaptor subunit n=1 Tax=Ureibacillus terrenus TaxID=118246 RepID=A0A540V2T8_9BACL|nr:efflux RND transporter periplasmic adaptor subunit [Ureibacillus terrenus]MED3661657.1 efflux RND transporter periplasmic adaptor subunit [Ureibacillus terrenus]MED3763562.1 efflux RND transporter periplasmic adaptor subunit [Ureibacillus terrenus]TQE91050.1 efflux RND transporter periplasmic adaptor subunit [Ureibacillus terrenus]